MLRSIIGRIYNGYKLVIKIRTVKIIFASLFCFCVGAVATGFLILSLNKFEEPNGVGGFESNTVPVAFDDDDTKSLSEVFATEAQEAGSVSLADDAEALIEDNAPASDSMQYSFEPAVLTYQTYRVKKGDMIGFIADDFDVTSDTIISINNIKQSRLIQPGQYLKIPSMPGILYTVKTDGETPQTIAKKYDVDAEKCALVNSTTVEASLSAGTSIFVPDAALDWMTRQEINGDLFHKPLRVRYWLSSPYGWRDSPFNTGRRSFHGGIDMAVGSGTPIYAALDGKVSAVGYNSTYGNYVIITHHSGYKTLYGHMSRVTCKKGNFVYTTTKIGEVGSTGLSTGPHLHFTVYKNGKTVNPLTLIN